jgi:hypothetical protein
LITWVFVALPTTANALNGIFTPRFTVYTLLSGLVSSVVATVAGAALYKEPQSTAAIPAAASAR